MKGVGRKTNQEKRAVQQPAKRVTVVLVLSGDTVTRHFQYPVDAVRFMNRNRKCVNGAIVRLGGFSRAEFGALLDYHHLQEDEFSVE